MKIKLSESREYLEYMDYFHRKNYVEAKKALIKCIKLSEAMKDNDALSFFYELLGEVEYFSGNIEKAIESYQKAEEVNKETLLPKYHFAIFLTEKLKKYEQAISECSSIINGASSYIRDKTVDDLPHNYYLSQCYALQGYCYGILGDFERAGSCLLHLMKIQCDYFIQYSVKLCEILITNGYFINESKSYLQDILERLKKSEKIENHRELIAKILKILKEDDFGKYQG